MLSLSAHLLPVSNLSEQILSASVYSESPGEAMAVVTVGHGAAGWIYTALLTLAKWVLSRGYYFLEGEPSGAMKKMHF